METRKEMIINEGEVWTAEQRRVVENALRRCNACRHCNFTEQICNLDPENPLPVYVYVGATGHIILLKPQQCRSYEWRGRNDGE